MQLAHTQFPILNEMATATRVLGVIGIVVLGVGYRYRKLLVFAVTPVAFLAASMHERPKTKNRDKHELIDI
jgi:aminoglycoside phosphotransferase